jgi:hypothetical protein
MFRSFRLYSDIKIHDFKTQNKTSELFWILKQYISMREDGQYDPNM